MQVDEEMTILEIAQISKLQRLWVLQSRKEFLEKEVKRVTSEYKKELSDLVPSLTFEEDAILKAAKVNGDSYREGTFKLIRKPRTVRTVNIDPFLDAYHDLDILKRIVKIEVGKAEAEIGKRALDKFVDKALHLKAHFDLTLGAGTKL